MNKKKEENLKEPEVKTTEATEPAETAEEKNPLEAQLEEMTAQKDDILDKYQRLAAEFDNYKKRTVKERDAIAESASSSVVKEFLPVMDSLEQAEKLIEDSEDSALKQGFELVARQINDALSKVGVVEIETKDMPFDPDLHEAVMHVEDENLGEGIIVEEFRRGYKIGDRVLRHSMVKVAN